MPTPSRKELAENNKGGFINRCMGSKEAKRVFPDEKQRLAFCNSRWSSKRQIQSMQVNILTKKIASFSQDELLSMIPGEVIAEIKQKDEHPYLQAYVLCHEGVATPTVIGEGGKKIAFPKQAIQTIKNVITKGIKFFRGHNGDNSTDNRDVLGEVVHSFEKEIGGKLSHVVIAYHSPEVREEAKNYDVCSQEAIWDFLEISGQLVADQIEKLTGIALGNSANEKPAFKDAVRLGVLYAFADEGNSEDVENVKEGKKMTFQELKQHIAELNVFPSQVFSIDEIKADREFYDVFAENENVKTKLEEKEKQITEMIKQNQLSTANERLEKLFVNMSVNDKAKLYINKVFEQTKDDIDASDESLQKFTEKHYKIYQEIAPVIDDTEIQVQSGDVAKDIDYNDPEFNELLAD